MRKIRRLQMTHEEKEPLYLDNHGERTAQRDKALQSALYIHLREMEEERNYEVRYVRDPEDPTLWRRKRIREYTKREKAYFKKNPKRKLL